MEQSSTTPLYKKKKKKEFARVHHEPSSEILILINHLTGISEKVLMHFSVPSAVFPGNVIALV